MMERSKARPITINVRPEVARFAELMERKLRANDHKGHWRGSSLSYLIARLREECGELIDAILYEEDSAPGHITEEAADVANFAMFIADAAGALEVDTEDVGSTVQLNKNMYSVRDEIDMPVWRCPRCKDMSILEDFDFCPSCGRRIEWVDYGLDGPKWVEEIRPIEPFANVTNRYRLFCLANGAESPEEMDMLTAMSGGASYLFWLCGHLMTWRRAQGIEPERYMTEGEHAAFDVWLERHVLGGDDQ